MLNKFRVRANSESGFTLVELLVVMLIIGLLAAIAIPAFFNQREKAKDSDAKAAVKTMQTAMETYSTDNSGSYAGRDRRRPARDRGRGSDRCAGAARPCLTISGTDGTNAANAGAPTASGIASRCTAKTTGNTFSIDRAATGTIRATCATGTGGGCPTARRLELARS